MNKNLLLKFIRALIVKKKLSIDNVSKNLLKLIYKFIEYYFVSFINFNNLINKSKFIINKMKLNFDSFKNSFLKYDATLKIDYPSIRKELNLIPTFNEKLGFEIKSKKLKIDKKFKFTLLVDKFTFNLYFYDSSYDIELYNKLSKIIFLFVKTFGYSEKLDNYNIRFLLIDYPRKLDSKFMRDEDSFKDLGAKGLYNNSSGINIIHKKELVLSRKSGITGLLIHELIHMLGLDFCYDFNDNVHTEIINWNNFWIKENNVKLKNHNVRSFIESICNSSSSYFLAIYNSIYLSSEIFKNNKQIIYFEYLLYIEFIYCYINCVNLLIYFNFKNYESMFNNNSNRVYYQNALVFEYVIMRSFIVSDYYNLLIMPMLKNRFNKNNNSDKNEKIQLELNKNLIKIVKNNKLKETFNKIFLFLLKTKLENYSMEYFAVNFI